ncbi:YeeE/YedE thiosulfate transporter family protein [Halarsenatibacter silvermanii]|uniref:Uncharacterized protein n=1 Tax=Halarsenatibacter silvermanii TaxID=321763 RepID=A0A1G9T733_9FIRM|nr:YeeE/YedE thiosulfate transporter family protein [Halarsenatibacter silvermanii]SDM43420.1 hypothetical protein SAMN04488692_1354 [Halarsenatibacter silvermanii]
MKNKSFKNKESGVSLTSKMFSYKKGAVIIAAVNLLIFLYTGRVWGITGGFVLTDPSPFSFPIEKIFLINLGVVFGAFYSLKSSGNFRMRGRCGLKRGILVFAGGLMMGYGARIAGGCNIKAMLNGMASFSLHGVIFAPAVILGVYAGSRMTSKYYG